MSRIYRHIGIEIPLEQYSDLSRIVYDTYVSLADCKPEKIKETTFGGYRRFVSLYPAEFIPVMINIINDYIEKQKP